MLSPICLLTCFQNWSIFIGNQPCAAWYFHGHRCSIWAITSIKKSPIEASSNAEISPLPTACQKGNFLSSESICLCTHISVIYTNELFHQPWTRININDPKSLFASFSISNNKAFQKLLRMPKYLLNHQCSRKLLLFLRICFFTFNSVIP